MPSSNDHAKHRVPGMRPPKAQPYRLKCGTACRAQTIVQGTTRQVLPSKAQPKLCIPCHVLLPPTAQPKRSRRGMCAEPTQSCKAQRAKYCCCTKCSPTNQSEALRAEPKRPHKAPSAKHAAAKSAAQTIKARHCVPAPNDHLTLYPTRGLSSEPSMDVGALGRPPGAPPGPPGSA